MTARRYACVLHATDEGGCEHLAVAVAGTDVEAYQAACDASMHFGVVGVIGMEWLTSDGAAWRVGKEE